MAYEDDEKVRADMRKLLRIVEEVRRLYPRMELGQLAVLLAIISDPGLWARDLTGKVGLKKSALSRNVKALSSVSYLADEDGEKRGGLDLIAQIPDAIDTRAFQLAPTHRGRQFAERLSELMKE